VKVLLPLSTSEVQEEEQPSLVLVADDNPGVLRFLSRALEVLGYQTVEAQDGHEAVRLFRELGHRISCVVLDVSMPFLDGPEAFEQIRELDARVPVLFSSGFSNMATTRQLSLDPYSGFLAKPFTMDTLQATLEKLFLKADNH
jgi:CheY-like chemotaxis protein